MIYSLPTDSRINIRHALFAPTPEALRELLSVLCSTGLWTLHFAYTSQRSRGFTQSQVTPLSYLTREHSHEQFGFESFVLDIYCIVFGLALATAGRAAAALQILHSTHYTVTDYSTFFVLGYLGDLCY